MRVLVTGANRGVGLGIARACREAGMDVVATARVPTDEAPVALDVTDPRAVARVLAAHGPLDGVVHNAVSVRSSEPTDLATASLELWEEHASVSLRALFHLARNAHEPLRVNGGSLLVLTSPAGMNGSAQLAFYAAVKGGQRAFVRSLAREWGPDGIRVNGLAPLAMTPALVNAFAEDPAMEPRLTGIIPLGRFGDPATDIGPAAAFLLSDAARYITGQQLVVSGGRLTIS